MMRAAAWVFRASNGEFGSNIYIYIYIYRQQKVGWGLGVCEVYSLSLT